jgi:hypothetical protein
LSGESSLGDRVLSLAEGVFRFEDLRIFVELRIAAVGALRATDDAAAAVADAALDAADAADDAAVTAVDAAVVTLPSSVESSSRARSL